MQENIPELVGVKSAAVPGFRNLRADDAGRLWGWDGVEWVRVGLGEGERVTVVKDDGQRNSVFKHKLVCTAWHGERAKNTQVRFRDGNRANLDPKNLFWLDVPKRTPRVKLKSEAPAPAPEAAPTGAPVVVSSTGAEVVVNYAGVRVGVRAAKDGAGFVVRIEQEGSASCTPSA